MYDVIIVGGGPSGASAGYFLSKAGLKCLILDRANFPREKACGGAITPRTAKEYPFTSDFLESTTFKGILHYKEPENSVPRITKEPLNYFVKRKIFDNQLLELSRNAGTEIKEGMKVTNFEIEHDKVVVICKNNEKFEGKFILGGDGIHSIIRKKSNLQKYWNNDTVAVILCEEKIIDEAILDKFYNKLRTSHIYWGFGDNLGYGWVFQKKNSINIGFGGILNGNKTKKLSTVFNDFIVHCKNENVIPDIEIKNPISWPLQMGGPMKKFASGRILLIGDSAGFIHPISGEGIYYAIVSAEISSNYIIKYIKGDISLENVSKNYHSTIMKKFGTELKLVAKDSLSVSPKITDLIFKLSKRDDKLRKLRSKMFTGEEDYKTLRRKLKFRVIMGYLRGTHKK